MSTNLDKIISYQDSNTSSPFWLWTDNCNKVELYTPVALTMSFASTRTDLLQTTGDGSADVPRITMGTPFQLSLDYHGTFEPYGSIDTSAYLWEKDTLHMTFEYPVYADGAYHEAGETWTQNSVPGTTFYPAYWAVEDLWSFQGVSDALNVIGVDGSASLHSRVGSMEKEANTDAANHQAWNDLMNRVDGILTGMRITDVADYPYLQYVFRDGGEGSPLTYKKSGYAINSGWKTFQGLTHLFNFGAGPQPEQTFPVVDGDTVGYKPYTVFKPGYKIRFNLTTIATLNSMDDYVMMEPEFYWVPSTGNVNTAAAEPVKVYYDEIINGSSKKLVEVGSDTDFSNVHQLCIGDKEMDADVQDILDSAKCYGTDLKTLYSAVTDAWTYGTVTVPGTMHVTEGKKNLDVLSRSYGDSQSLPVPDRLKDSELVQNCLQTWYGEYYLPNTIHVRSAGSDSQFNQDVVGGINYRESYWKNEGYLLVRFNIYTVKNGNKHLLYDATDTSNEGHAGYCDMWAQERAGKNSKTDSHGTTFNWTSGDFLLYSLNSSMSDDYRTGGTH